MNVRRNRFALVLLLSVSLAGVASAIPPRTHSIRGEVVAIDADKESFVLRDERTRAETTIRWKSHSRFIASDGRGGPCCLSTGVVAKVSFRREVGEKVAREVRWPTAACK
jgi:hypothetical protein